MADAKYDVLGIGNAIFDVLVQTDEEFLADHGMTKGGMALIDEAARRRDLQATWARPPKCRGGSGANTIVGVAGFGARAAYIGKVKDDQIGTLYTHDIRAAGVAYETQGGGSRPRHRLLLHPGDAGRRAHHEHLSRRGAGSVAVGYRRSPVAAARIVYLEGYLWDPRTPRKPSSRPPPSRMRPAARWR